jgi:hypothetical protein
MRRSKYVLIIVIIIILLLIFLYNNRIIEAYDTKLNMKDCNVIFAGTVKNVDKYIEKNLEHIDTCGKKFKNYIVIIYENDSTDLTRSILNRKKKSNYYYIFENNITEPKRTVRIANGRNKILEKANELNKNNSYDCLIMLDLDDVNISGKFIDSIDSCFELNKDWDVLTGNQSDKYYDIYALRKKGLIEFDCWKEASKAVDKGMNIEEAKQKYVFGIVDKFDKDQLIEVDSAFSGIAIYRLSSIASDCKYVGTLEDNSDICEHVLFHKCLKDNNKKIYINTNFLTN